MPSPHDSSAKAIIKSDFARAYLSSKSRGDRFVFIVEFLRVIRFSNLRTEKARVRVVMINDTHAPVEVLTSVYPFRLKDGIGAPKKSRRFIDCGKSIFIFC